MTPGIPTILKIGFATGNNVLESVGLGAERACRCNGERPFAEIFLSSKSTGNILDDKIKDVFRPIMMSLSPKIASMLTTLKKCR